MNAQEAMRLVVVSNRLPIVLQKDGEKLSVKPGVGGLVTALARGSQKSGWIVDWLVWCRG